MTLMGNLPLPLDAFIGRDSLVQRARGLLESSRCLTIIGPGGVGKTCLALRLARAAREPGAYPDGVWLVGLGELDPGADEQQVARTVVETLGVCAQGTAPPLTVLVEALADSRLLLVVDNCEHVINGAATVVGRLVAQVPALRVIATSRRALSVPGEQVLPVPPLSAPKPDEPVTLADADRFEAIRLFVDRARASSPTFQLGPDNVASVGELCAALDGLPLAVEMAARKIRVAPFTELVRRMLAPETGDRLALLSGTAHVGPLRHRTLRALVDWSYELCSAQEQLVWVRCSVFRGSFDAAAAEVVCAGEGITQNEVFEMLGGLVDHSDMRLDAEDRYSLLALQREYGASLLRASGDEERLHERHADYYRRLVIRAERAWWGPDQLRWLAHLQRERANIRAAITHYLATPGGAAGAMEILSALRCWWSTVFGGFSEARELMDRALALDPEPHRQRAAALWAAGYLALRQGDLEAADELLAESCVVAEQAQDLNSLTCAMHLQGLVEFFRGDPVAAVELLRQALDRCRSLADDAGVWMAWCHLSMATASTGDYAAAEGYGRQCLEAATARTALLSRSGALWALGWGRWLAGDVPAAEELLVEGLEVMREHGDVWGVAECQEVLAWIAAADGKRDEYAARLLGAAQAAWQTVGAYVRLRPLAIQHDECVTRLRGRLGARAFAVAVQAGARGELSVLPAVAAPVPAGALATLTERELEVTALIATGLSSQEIADKLIVSVRTVHSHAANAFAKLGVHNRAQLTAVYLRAMEAGEQEQGELAPAAGDHVPYPRPLLRAS